MWSASWNGSKAGLCAGRNGQGGLEQTSLSAEVVVDQGDIDASPRRHGAHRRPLKPETRKQRPCR
jgi:hypothetical protein